MSQKRSPVWIYFEENEANKRYAKCKVCHIQVDRTESRTTKLLFDHLRKWHKDEYKVTEDIQKKKKSNSSIPGNDGESSMNHGSNAGAGSSDCVDIPKTLRTKQERNHAFQLTIPDWTESQKKMPFHSKKALEFHQSVFEMFILDCRPFSMVNDRGFLRLLQKIAPDFEVIAMSFYTAMEEFESYIFSGCLSHLLQQSLGSNIRES